MSKLGIINYEDGYKLELWDNIIKGIFGVRKIIFHLRCKYLTSANFFKRKVNGRDKYATNNFRNNRVNNRNLAVLMVVEEEAT